MRSVESFFEERKRLHRTAFLAAYPHGFLTRVPGSSLPSGVIAFHTGFVKDSPVGDPTMPEALPQRAAVALVKRDSNPFPERLVLGRAPNCDVVVRASFISKVHAQIDIGASGRLSISDRGSANGTKVNGVTVNRDAVVIVPGDRLDLGALSLTLLRADEMLALLDKLERAVRAARPGD